MSVITSLTTARDNIAAAIATASASPGPNYSIEGQSISKADYITSLLTQLRMIEAQIADSAGPWEETYQVQV